MPARPFGRRLQRRRASRPKFLALPSPTSVIVDVPHSTDNGGIRARVLLYGKDLIPEPGSYLAELNGTGVSPDPTGGVGAMAAGAGTGSTD
jgi:hypothetical protein